jgi:hypothetical protein
LTGCFACAAGALADGAVFLATGAGLAACAVVVDLDGGCTRETEVAKRDGDGYTRGSSSSSSVRGAERTMRTVECGVRSDDADERVCSDDDVEVAESGMPSDDAGGVQLSVVAYGSSSYDDGCDGWSREALARSCDAASLKWLPAPTGARVVGGGALALAELPVLVLAGPTVLQLAAPIVLALAALSERACCAMRGRLVTAKPGGGAGRSRTGIGTIGARSVGDNDRSLKVDEKDVSAAAEDSERSGDAENAMSSADDGGGASEDVRGGTRSGMSTGVASDA